MGGKSAFVLLLVVSCILTSAVMAVGEPFCTSRFDFEEKLLHKVLRIEHAMELLQDKVAKQLAEFENRQADETFAKDVCRCPDTWVNFNGSCYLFSKEAKTFLDADQFCQQQQSHLVKIDNSNENNFLKSHSSDLKGGSRWISLTDVTVEGEWVWTDGFKPFYLDWLQGEPNGHKGENCAMLYDGYKYQWNDVSCGSIYLPICERLLSECQSCEGSIDG